MIDLKAKLKEHRPTIGSWLQLNSPDVAEIMSKAGYEWLVIDMEHGSISIGDLPNLIRAIEIGGAVPLVRVSENDPYLIKRVLDAGAAGIIVPMIQSAAEVKRAVQAALYPPAGIRGIGYSRTNAYGSNFKNYFTTFHDRIVIIPQIENISAVNDIEAIFSEPGIDAFIIGPYDLSGSMNKTGQFTDPEVVEAVERVRLSAKHHGIPAGIHVIPPDPKEVQQRVDEGFRFIAVSVDAYMLSEQAIKVASTLNAFTAKLPTA